MSKVNFQNQFSSHYLKILVVMTSFIIKIVSHLNWSKTEHVCIQITAKRLQHPLFWNIIFVQASKVLILFSHNRHWWKGQVSLWAIYHHELQPGGRLNKKDGLYIETGPRILWTWKVLTHVILNLCYENILPFSSIEMVQVVEILPHGRQRNIYAA